MNLGPGNRTVSYRNKFALDPTGGVCVRFRCVGGIWMPVAAVFSIGLTNYSTKYLNIVMAGTATLAPVTVPPGNMVVMRPHSKIQWINLKAPGGISKNLVHCYQF